MNIGLFFYDKTFCYGSLDYFMLSIEEGLQRFGIHTERICNMEASMVGKRYDAFVGFNSQDVAMKLDETNYVLDYFNCPFFNIIVDPPYYHHGALVSHMKNLRLIVLDSGHVEYAKRYYPPCQSVELGYLLGPVGETVPYENRKIDLLFTGSWVDYREIKKRFMSDKYPHELQNIFLYVVDRGIKEPYMTTERMVRDYLKENDWAVSNEDFCLFMNIVGVQAEYYLRGYYREKIVRTLTDAGLQVTVAGVGWNNCFNQPPKNLNMLGEVTMEETSRFTANARILLNVMPWFKDGLHDRILTAMHNGAICVTDSSSYIDTHFQDGENIVLYRLEELEALPDKCRYLLKHPEKAKAIAEAGRQKAQLEYTWDKFILDNIIKYFI